MSQYTIQVTFTRDFEKDVAVIGANPELLVKMFVRELQEVGYDEGWVDGDFQVNSITINGETTGIQPDAT